MMEVLLYSNDGKAFRVAKHILDHSIVQSVSKLESSSVSKSKIELSVSPIALEMFVQILTHIHNNAQPKDEENNRKWFKQLLERQQVDALCDLWKLAFMTRFD